MKKRLLPLAVLLLLTSPLLSGCGSKDKIYNPPSLPSGEIADPFPTYEPWPQLSNEFYEKAPKQDLDKLMVREEKNLGDWKKAKARFSK